MKKNLVLISAFALPVILASCSQKQSDVANNETVVAVDSVASEEVADTVPEEALLADSIEFTTITASVNKGKFSMSATYTLPVPDGNKMLRNLCDSIIGPEYDYDKLQEQLESKSLEMYNPEDDFGYEEEKSVEPVGVYGGYIGYSYSYYSYSEGGAHGYGGAYNKTFEISTGKVLTEEDIFNCTDSNMEAIEVELRKKLDEYVGESMDDYGYITMFNGSFIFDKDGLTYTYEPMSVAPYAEGEISLTLSKNFLKPYLRKDGPLYMLWFGMNNSSL